ncbi:recombinase family protein [Streptomyces virginiae]
MTPTMSLTRENVRRGTFAAAGASATFKPVGSYGRLSEDKALKTGRTDREEGEQVATQFKRNRVLSDSLNWTIVREYNDNNIPASDPLIVRPDFEQMLKDLESGVIEGIVFTHSDRVARLEYDAARINRLYTINPKLVGRSVDGGTDLSTVEGRAMFMMQATMGGVEVYNTKRRTSGTNLANAERGRRHHGRRAFGWNSDGTLHPEESRLLAAAIRAVPGGLRVGNFRKQLIALGYEPRPDKRRKEGAAKYNLQHSTVESYLVNPAVCGYVAYLAQADRRGGKKVWMPDHVLYVDGQPVIGNWPKIVEPEEWAACVETLEKRKQDRKDGNQQPHDTSDKYVLSGFVRCGKCSFPLLANPYTKGTTAYEKWGYRYACLSNQGGCGGITRVGPPIEELVIKSSLPKYGAASASSPRPRR